MYWFSCLLWRSDGGGTVHHRFFLVQSLPSWGWGYQTSPCWACPLAVVSVQNRVWRHWHSWAVAWSFVGRLVSPTGLTDFCLHLYVSPWQIGGSKPQHNPGSFLLWWRSPSGTDKAMQSWPQLMRQLVSCMAWCTAQSAKGSGGAAWGWSGHGIWPCAALFILSRPSQQMLLTSIRVSLSPNQYHSCCASSLGAHQVPPSTTAVPGRLTGGLRLYWMKSVKKK